MRVKTRGPAFEWHSALGEARFFLQALREMSKLECQQCGMSVSGLSCGKCGKELEHTILKKDDGREVHVSKCPAGCGLVKSPMCCGHDMACKI